MDKDEGQEEALGERYRAMLKGYYERLRRSDEESRASSAIEEVKLRLFLSLLDKPFKSSADGSMATDAL
jgi:hypothetical protein